MMLCSNIKGKASFVYYNYRIINYFMKLILNNSKSQIGLVFIFFLSITQLIAQPLASKGQVIDKIVAKVDNHIVLKSELEATALQYMAQQQFKTSIENLNCTVLESLLINKLLLAKADIDSVTIEDKQVEAQLNQRMAYFIQQIGSEEKLVEMYNKPIAELKNDLRKQVKEQILAQKMQDNVVGKVKITPGEVKKFFAKIPQDSLPFFSKEVEVGQIVLEAKVGKDQKNVTRNELLAIKARIEKGEDFGALAKQFSADPGSAVNGGELGFFKKGDLVPEYEAASLKLKPGQMSDVIESQFGFHLIQLIERRGMEFNTRHILLKPASSTVDISETENELNKIRNSILKDSITFTSAAKKFSDDKTTSENGGFFTDATTGSTQIAVDAIDPSIFFVIDTMQVGHICKPIPYRTADGKDAMRIIYLKKVTPPHKANLEDDFQKIHSAAVAAKKNKVLSEWFHKTKNEVFVEIAPEFKSCDILKDI